MRTLLIAAAFSAVSFAAYSAVSRDILWVALQSCVVAQKTTGHPFPCLSVDPATAAHPGTAILRPPGQATHIVVMPTEAVAGLEAPMLQGSAGVAYWTAVLAARENVVQALKGRIALADVGIAINSRTARSQDHLHIHLDCVKPGVRAALATSPQRIAGRWVRLATPLEDSRFYAMKVEVSDLSGFNPFATLSDLPGGRLALDKISFAALSVDGGQSTFMLALPDPGSDSEKLLDHACSIARPHAQGG
jgi:CDP-diacylglycerol pyrophosphatase